MPISQYLTCKIASAILAFTGLTYLAIVILRKTKGGSIGWKYLIWAFIFMDIWIVIDLSEIFIGAVGSPPQLDTLHRILYILETPVLIALFLLLVMSLHDLLTTMEERPWKLFGEKAKKEP